MIHLFVNGLAASAGGGLTYLRNVLPELSARPGVRVTAAVNPELRSEFGTLLNLSLPDSDFSGGAMARFWQEQTRLPALIRRSGASVLVSTGNFALRKSPVPQILLSRNSLYTSTDFLQDLRRRHHLGLWLDTRMKGKLAQKSVRWADRTVTPTEAFAQGLRRWTGGPVTSIHHGFDRDSFFRDDTPLDIGVQQKLGLDQQADANSHERCGKSPLRLLFVSHYNYYRNFETLLRALPILRKRLEGRKTKLFLTCRLRSEENPGTYRANDAASLVNELGVADSVAELGSIPYSSLHQVYRACDIYVTPAYAESFAHPLVEAMSSGLPVVAADTAVHREICENAAIYFQRFSPEELADGVCRIAASEPLARELAERGLKRSSQFSWSRHVDQLLDLAANLLATMNPVQRV